MLHPDAVTLGEVCFIAHALVIPSIDAADREQYEEQVETTAMRFAMAYEQSFGAQVRDVSKPALARLAGLGDVPGFDLLSTRSVMAIPETAAASRSRVAPAPATCS